MLDKLGVAFLIRLSILYGIHYSLFQEITYI